MLTRKSTILLIAIGLVLIPVGAQASGSADGFFDKKRGTKPGVSFGVVKPGQERTIVRGPAPRRGGGGGLKAIVQTSRQALQASMLNTVRQTRAGCFAQLAAAVPSPAGALSSACLASDPNPRVVEATPAGGPGTAVEVVDAAALAQRAASQLDLVKPTLNTSPQDPVKALVGLETWLWVPQGQWRTLSESVEVGDTEVTVTARPVQTRWDMGESTATCNNAGREWRKGLGQSATTPCGYTYKRTSVREPNKKHDVSALIRYDITWACEGNCSEDAGDLGTLDSATSTGQLQVSERQSVVLP